MGLWVSLKRIKQQSPDDFPAFLASDCVNVFARPLHILFNLSLADATFPECWQRARVCPVLKSGDPSELLNYRPAATLRSCEISVYTHLFPLVKNVMLKNRRGFFEG